MLAACLKSAIHIHKAPITEKAIGSETVQDRSLFPQLDQVLLSPEQKVTDSKFLTSFKWHHLAMGLAGISKRKYPIPSHVKGMPHPIMVTSLMTPEPSSGVHADLPQVENWCMMQDPKQGVASRAMGPIQHKEYLRHWKQIMFSHPSFPKVHLHSGNKCARYHLEISIEHVCYCI